MHHVPAYTWSRSTNAITTQCRPHCFASDSLAASLSDALLQLYPTTVKDVSRKNVFQKLSDSTTHKAAWESIPEKERSKALASYSDVANELLDKAVETAWPGKLQKSNVRGVRHAKGWTWHVIGCSCTSCRTTHA